MCDLTDLAFPDVASAAPPVANTAMPAQPRAVPLPGNRPSETLPVALVDCLVLFADPRFGPTETTWDIGYRDLAGAWKSSTGDRDLEAPPIYWWTLPDHALCAGPRAGQGA